MIRLPFGGPEETADLLEELMAAADLVASGAVRRIVLAAFPGVEDVAAARSRTPRDRGRLPPVAGRHRGGYGPHRSARGMIGGRRPLQGRKAGDRRVRVERPHTAYFRYTGPGQMVAREAASRPRSRSGRAFAKARGALFGRPLSNYEDIEERLPKKKALAIFSSDAISSSAYATEEILRVLVLAGRAR